MRRTILLVVLLVSASILASAQQTSPAATSAQASSSTSGAMSDNVQALKSDAERMSVLLNQMRSNLGNIQNTTTPLNHQFALEIDMWQVVLGQLQRHIADLEREAPRSAK